MHRIFLYHSSFGSSLYVFALVCCVYFLYSLHPCTSYYLDCYVSSDVRIVSSVVYVLVCGFVFIRYGVRCVESQFVINIILCLFGGHGQGQPYPFSSFISLILLFVPSFFPFYLLPSVARALSRSLSLSHFFFIFWIIKRSAVPILFLKLFYIFPSSEKALREYCAIFK